MNGVTIDPAVQGGDPCVGDTRIPAEMIADLWWRRDYTISEFHKAYGLKRGQLLTVFWYMGVYGNLKWRRRWKSWAESVGESLWYREYTRAPYPPQEATP